jgi:hypothetical protein
MENESNKMTAVQWFIEQLEQKGDAWENVSIRRVQISIDTSDYLELKRQAKQMEKEKQKYFFDCGRQYQLTGEGTFKEVWDETYGGNK